MDTMVVSLKLKGTSFPDLQSHIDLEILKEEVKNSKKVKGDISLTDKQKLEHIHHEIDNLTLIKDY